jgi:hypothetical protein
LRRDNFSADVRRQRKRAGCVDDAGTVEVAAADTERPAPL